LIAPRFRWECLSIRTVNWFPAPATSNPSCRFPAMGLPACFSSGVLIPDVYPPPQGLAHESVFLSFTVAFLVVGVTANSRASSLRRHYSASSLSGRRRRACALTSVRRPNCSCSFPASSFYGDAFLWSAKEGINPTKLTSPYSPYSFVSGSSFQPRLRHRLHRCDQIRRTIHPSRRWKSLRT
jgi:hypothetical protein